VITLAALTSTQTDTLDSQASRRMSPKPVTRNVTNDRVGGIVFRNKIIPKNSIDEADEKKPTENNYS